jgi:hypothetical protein
MAASATRRILRHLSSVTDGSQTAFTAPKSREVILRLGARISECLDLRGAERCACAPPPPPLSNTGNGKGKDVGS